MELTRRWGECPGEWRLTRDQVPTYWTCTGCGTSYLHDDEVMLAAMREYRMGRMIRFLARAGTRLLREPPYSR